MKLNFGYRLGMQTRRFVRWLSMQETRLQQRGVPSWITKLPLYLCIAAAVGLLVAGALFAALFLALMIFIAWCLVTATKGGIDLSYNDEPVDGYNATGPEGPGYYYSGRKIDD
ncbi:hypothetical protein CF038_21620 [Klebsiella michiganensis]|uniref:DUF3742 family protein n=1 Tax=Klebsiella michiganensis TaxID=1134687 RepID=UPI000E06B256|nr:DUF3742 family protein [Klebsiella michiganensis]MBA8306160.1 DUF3742 family protein [Klebsiella michiganensis]MBW5931899.1 hypothetical protein [Klebsiella michiganensis]MBW5933804.1 hypothetical protein [Klebsiella michiganensis]MBW5995209.1 hypothetical protein [Klebsiella michiganensis]MBX4818554.1 hypothetical protein [Klebsiella michiganensis]